MIAAILSTISLKLLWLKLAATGMVIRLFGDGDEFGDGYEPPIPPQSP